MKDNKADKTVQEKMESLSPLSGGIVFGKEEAWEKLQQRLDKKTDRRIPFIYWLSAAAVLVVLLSIPSLLQKPAQPMARVTEDKKQRPDTLSDLHRELPTVISQPETVATNLTVGMNKPRRKRHEIEIKTLPTFVLPDTLRPDIPVVKNEVREVAVAPRPSVSDIVRKMRVVHINDLGKDAPEPEQSTSLAENYTPVFEKKRMPVIHVNQLTHEEFELQQIMSDTRLTLGKMFLFKQDRYLLFDHSPQSQPYGLVKFRLN